MSITSNPLHLVHQTRTAKGQLVQPLPPIFLQALTRATCVGEVEFRAVDYYFTQAFPIPLHIRSQLYSDISLMYTY